jgi:hypothetical protein
MTNSNNHPHTPKQRLIGIAHSFIPLGLPSLVFEVPANIDADNMTKSMMEAHTFRNEKPKVYLSMPVGGYFG